MTRLAEPPYQAPLVREGPLSITERWQVWLTALRRYTRAELVTGTATMHINLADGGKQSVDVPVTEAAQGDPAIAGFDHAGVDGVHAVAHSKDGLVRVTVINNSGTYYNTGGAVTVRASAWKH